ncbi:MAG: hypothetical protein HS109_04770 [Burkholderiales bacterium]|nr:hypothetical protein [Burkholderiales bacterium]MCE7877762.1 hypothetical protein [Betaproteobacteria bacterium PRO3]
MRDFVPVANLARQTKVLLASLATPVTTVRALAILAAQGLDPIGRTPESFAAEIRTDREKWGGLAASLGIARR